MRVAVCIVLLLGLCSSCEMLLKDRTENSSDSILCEVYDQRLMYSEVSPVIPPGSSTNDSILFVKSYVDRWVKDALLLREAELSVSSDLDIEEMVDDYRASLLLVNYERRLFAETLQEDPLDAELNEYYNGHLDDFKLGESIAKLCLYKPVKKDQRSRVLWDRAKAEGFDLLAEACKEDEAYCFLDSTIWLPYSEINSLLPEARDTDDWLKDGEISIKDIHLHIFAHRRQTDQAPFDYVREEVRRSLLHEKRSQLIQQKRNELYQNELDKTNVKNYVQ